MHPQSRRLGPEDLAARMGVTDDTFCCGQKHEHARCPAKDAERRLSEWQAHLDPREIDRIQGWAYRFGPSLCDADLVTSVECAQCQ